MTKKMTVVFHDEELYIDLKIEAVRRHKPASEIIAEAVRDWLDMREEEELLPEIDAALAEYEEKGGYSWEEVKKELEESRAKRKNVPIIAERKDI